MGSSDQFNIRWNNYTTVLQNVFRKLLEGEQFVDVTLACEGQSIKCHRLILSACSTYFDRILTENPTPNLVIYLKDMKFWEMRALVTFMYNGEVSVSQQKLPLLCKAAEALKIKGLAHDGSLTEDDLAQMDDDEIEEYHRTEVREVVQRENHRIQGQPKSLLRQPHTNLSALIAAATASSNRQQQPMQVKRKNVTQPPKLVKMLRVERPSNGNGNANVKPPLSLGKAAGKKDTDANTSNTTPCKKEHNLEQEMDESYSNDMPANSSIKEEENSGVVLEENEEIEGCEENESAGTDGEDSLQGNTNETAKPKVSMKYGKEIRDSALTALQSGMSLRECSETYGVPRKTISKWKSRDAKNEGEDGTANSGSSSPKGVQSKGSSSPKGGQSKEATPVAICTGAIVLPPKTTMGAPVDSADRAERLKKATELALSGVTVRQAAAHYEIPRTTLCAYMKRRGLAGKRNFLPTPGANNSAKRVTIKPENTNNGEANGQSRTSSSSHYEDFPFLGISELMDEMGQVTYDAEGYAEGEEGYSEK